MDLSATFGYESFKQDGMRLFIKTMTSNEDVAAKLATDMQALLESAWNQKGQLPSMMLLCRLVGYTNGLIGVVTGIHNTGAQFIPVNDEDGKAVSMWVNLHPEQDAKPNPLKPSTDLDKLEGPEFEAALAKLPEAERAKYMNAE